MTAEELLPYAGVLEHWAYSPQDVRELLADAHAHYVAQMRQPCALPQHAGVPAIPEMPKPYTYGEPVDIPGGICESARVRYFSSKQMNEYAQAAIAGWKNLSDEMQEECAKLGAMLTERDKTIAGLEADLREEQDRRQAARNEWAAEVAGLSWFLSDETTEAQDDTWSDAAEAFTKAAGGLRGHLEWRDKIRAAVRVLIRAEQPKEPA